MTKKLFKVLFVQSILIFLCTFARKMGRSVKLTHRDKLMIVNYHNDIRRLIFASNMQTLVSCINLFLPFNALDIDSRLIKSKIKMCVRSNSIPDISSFNTQCLSSTLRFVLAKPKMSILEEA